MFKLVSDYKATGDQPQAIDKLARGIGNKTPEQVLLGVTGSGKTFTVANVIAKTQKPTLIISHNKTLAAQLYQEFRDFFPENAVNFFVSYYDYYQPEAYVPQTDTYIEKETDINEDLDKLRLAATTNILTRRDSIVIASVSCIYNIGSPREYGHFVLELHPGMRIDRNEVFNRLVALQYERNNYEFRRGVFRVVGETIDLYPAYSDTGLRFILSDGLVKSINQIDPLTGKSTEIMGSVVVYPAKHYMTDPSTYREVFDRIRADLDKQVTEFKKQNKLIEAQRITQRVNYDLDMLAELGYVNGIENYSRYFDGRKSGDPPYTLFDYFNEAYKKDGWMLVIDESHMTVPQIRGMYNGDRSRKQTLIDFGFRLPSALDNRPLRFDEFMRRIPPTIYVSATPAEWELDRVRATGSRSGESGVVEQLIRPTGLTDPEVVIRPSSNQIADLTEEIKKRIPMGQRIMVTTLTKRMAEDLTEFLKKNNIKVNYLHSDIETLKRSDVISDLRLGAYDVIVGVNLLREGLDLPEVALVAILDADREGFLRSQTSLIQTMGRAARNASGEVILYANRETPSMKNAISEVNRRRKIQSDYNKIHSITPQSIVKPVRNRLVDLPDSVSPADSDYLSSGQESSLSNLTAFDKSELVKSLTAKMKAASKNLDFEQAAHIRDLINELKKTM